MEAGNDCCLRWQRVWRKGRMAGSVHKYYFFVSMVDMPKNQGFVEETQPVKARKMRSGREVEGR